MSDQNPEEITIYAKPGYLKYGDAYIAQILSMRPSKDNDNNDVWDIILRPSQELIKAYNIRKGNSGVDVRDDGSILIRQQIPYDYLIQLNPDPGWNWWFSILNYNGDINPAVKRVFNTNLLNEINDLKKIIENLKQQKEVQSEKVHLMETNLPKYLQKNVIPILEGVIPLAEKLMPNKPQMKDNN